MFYPDRGRVQYLFNQETVTTWLQMNKVTTRPTKTPKTFHLPVDLDSEFQIWHDKYAGLLSEHNVASLTLTVQLKPVHETDTFVYCHPDVEILGFPTKYPVFRSGFVVVDFLNGRGVPAKIESVGSDPISREQYKILSKIRRLRVWIYAHFAVADVLRMATGSFQETLVELCHDQVGGTKFVQDRRLKAQMNKGYGRDYLQTDHVISIGNVPYALQLVIVDSVATHGEGSRSLAGLAGNVGVEMLDKSNFTKDEKSLMLDQYLNQFDRFDPYCRGDLAVYRCLEANKEKFFTIYQKLNVEQYFQPPSPTIGATISRLIESRIFDRFGIDPQDRQSKKFIVENFCKPASPDDLARNKNSYLGLLAKVTGARAFNNRPRTTRLEGAIFDTDLAGAYARSMLDQVYPLGRPYTYEKPLENQTVLTLREFLKKHREQFVEGLFLIMFDVAGELPFDQDFFHSYTPPVKRGDTLDYCDFFAIYGEGNSWLDDQDETKIYSREIKHTLLTSDSLQWLETVATPEFRKIILDQSNVLAAMWYPKSERVETIDKLMIEYRKSPEQYDQTTNYKAGSVTTDDKRCRKWFGLNLGDLLINDLLSEREKYDKRSPDPLVRAMNALFKLCANTTFGVTGSRYFSISNTVVGNNITARVRVAIWAVEKSLRCQQSITDGGAGDLNQVAYPRPGRKLNEQSTVQTERNPQEIAKRVQYKPIGGYDKITWSPDGEHLEFWLNGEVEILAEKPALQKIDKLILEHCRFCFPDLEVFNRFKFETKGVVKVAVFHGLTNYLFLEGWHEKYKEGLREMVAMRSYSKNPDDEPGLFLKSLAKNPRRVERRKPYVVGQILKVNEYRDRFKSYSKTVLLPGDSYQKTRWIHEFSTSQFLYRNKEQRKKWSLLVQKLVGIYGQSFESEYLNLDGSLNFERMIATVDDWISRNLQRPPVTLKTATHPELTNFNRLKEQLNNRFLKIETTISDTFTSNDAETLVDLLLDELFA